MMVDAIIFDVDGVLLDTSGSYTAAVVEAVTVATGSDRFTTREAAQLKAIKGFNNDWHVAIAGAAWVKFGNRQSFPEFTQVVDGAGGGLTGLKHVVGPALTQEFEIRLTRLAQESYGGTSACRQLYGFEPESIRHEGLWRTETPLLSRSQAGKWLPRIGIVTGRTRAEMEQGFYLLGWRVPAEQLAVSDDPALDKPNPQKLVAILAGMESRKALYVGDARDDLELVSKAQSTWNGALQFGYVGPAPCPWPEVRIVAADVAELIGRIEVVPGES